MLKVITALSVLLIAMSLSAPRHWGYRGEMLVVLKSKQLTTP